MVNRTDTKALPKERPLGLSLFLDVITPKEEEVVLDSIALLTTPWERPILRPGLPKAKREMVCFGWNYITNGRKLRPGPEMPPFISSLRNRCAEVASQDPTAFIQAIVTRYDVGAGINWHTDAPVFGPTVLTLSVNSDWHMDFKPRGVGSLIHVPLPRRSLLVLSNDSRNQWYHRIPPVQQLRYSLSFRSLVDDTLTI